MNGWAFWECNPWQVQNPRRLRVTYFQVMIWFGNGGFIAISATVKWFTDRKRGLAGPSSRISCFYYRSPTLLKGRDIKSWPREWGRRGAKTLRYSDV